MVTTAAAHSFLVDVQFCESDEIDLQQQVKSDKVGRQLPTRCSMTWLMMLCRIAAGLVLIAQTTATETGGEKDDERKISLSEIVTTSPQKGLQPVRDVLAKKGDAQATEGYLSRILTGSNGSSNAFLVDATNIYDALQASSTILDGARSADTPAPVNTSQPTRGSHWLVAYLGTGPSSPTWWTIESVTIHKGKIVLKYRMSKPSPTTADLNPYYYWIPIGKLPLGAYEIKLVDADQAAVSLMRRIEVAPK